MPILRRTDDHDLPCIILHRTLHQAFAVPFGGRVRENLFNEILFESLVRARAVLETWRADDNQQPSDSSSIWTDVDRPRRLVDEAAEDA